MILCARNTVPNIRSADYKDREIKLQCWAGNEIKFRSVCSELHQGVATLFCFLPIWINKFAKFAKYQKIYAKHQIQTHQYHTIAWKSWKMLNNTHTHSFFIDVFNPQMYAQSRKSKFAWKKVGLNVLIVSGLDLDRK